MPHFQNTKQEVRGHKKSIGKYTNHKEDGWRSRVIFQFQVTRQRHTQIVLWEWRRELNSLQFSIWLQTPLHIQFIHHKYSVVYCAGPAIEAVGYLYGNGHMRGNDPPPIRH
jgi:hypothetical protein